MADRAYDVVLFGATGFTGSLTAAYLARHAPAGTRWAIAGRNRARLEGARDSVAQMNPPAGEPGIVLASVEDRGSVRRLAEQTRVAISTVGPYLRYGEPLVGACAEAGTDYLDLCGEPEFVDQMYLDHHATAVHTGARLVHACGFDSVPFDIGVYFTVHQLPECVPIHIDGYLRLGAGISAGTYHSAITAMSRFRHLADLADRRRSLEQRPTDRRARGKAGGPGRTAVGYTLPLPTIDPQIVARSARALPRYGPDFSYRHHVLVGGLPRAVALVSTVGAAFALAQLPPSRRLLMERMRPGEGPSPERRARSWFTVRFVGEGGGERVVTEVSGGDPGYDETAKMLSESALSLAFDDNPGTKGQVTTAVAMGDHLLRRLTAAGITVRAL
jgi:saccharopine dehydrogenase (NAD+, L-glutamate forming)